MSQVFDSKEQESKFQDIYEQVKIPPFSTRHLTENDLRIVFLVGVSFGMNRAKEIYSNE